MENNSKLVAFAVVAMALAGIVSVGAISLNNADSQENETETETTASNETAEEAVPAPAPETEDEEDADEEETSVSTETEVAGSFASVKTTQNKDYISILVTKNPSEAAPPAPDVPVIIVPGEGENGTIVVPDENQTNGGGNVTVIDPAGNITQIPDGNVTIIDNDTVIVAPPDENITETPGNVTVIDPEPPLPPTPEECGCPPAAGGGNETAPAGNETGGIPPVEVIPAPGQNVTVGDNETTEPETPPSNETGTPTEPEPEPAPPADNATAPATGNETATEGGDNATNGEPTEAPVVEDGNQTNIENSTIEVNPAAFEDNQQIMSWLHTIGLA